MHFYAHLKIGSPVDADWRRMGLRSGMLEKVVFMYVIGHSRYEAGEITPVQLENLKKLDSVIIEMTSGPGPKMPTHQMPSTIQ